MTKRKQPAGYSHCRTNKKKPSYMSGKMGGVKKPMKPSYMSGKMGGVKKPMKKKKRMKTKDKKSTMKQMLGYLGKGGQ